MAGRYERIPLSAGDHKSADEGDENVAVCVEGDQVPDLPLDHFVLVNVPQDLLLGSQSAVKMPLQVEFFPGASVKELKRLITSALASKACIDLPPERQRLAFGGRMLSDDTALLSVCGVSTGARIHVFPKPLVTPSCSASQQVPLAAPSSLSYPVVSGVVVAQVPVEGRRNNTPERLERRTRVIGAHNQNMLWAFRLRIFCMLCLFFYGFGLISNLAFWMGDRDVPDDREIVGVDDTASDTMTTIYTLDFMSNSIGLLAATLGMKAVRLSSIPFARRHLQMILLLVFVSAVQLCTELYSFSERYEVYRNTHSGAAGRFPGGNSTASERSPQTHDVTSKQYDELLVMVGMNVLVRLLFWTMLLRTGKKYLTTLIASQLLSHNLEDISHQSEPRAPVVVSIGTPVATAATSSQVV